MSDKRMLDLRSLAASGVSAASQLDEILELSDEELFEFASAHRATADEVLSLVGVEFGEKKHIHLGIAGDRPGQVFWICDVKPELADSAPDIKLEPKFQDLALQLAAVIHWLAGDDHRWRCLCHTDAAVRQRAERCGDCRHHQPRALIVG